MSEIILKFDGTYVKAYEDGVLVQSWLAISGDARGEYLDPQYTNMEDHGPIPEGNYTVDPNAYQSISNISNANYLASFLNKITGRGQWPGVETAWGSERIELTPDSGTDVFDRGGFFMHGGSFPGSAGCIDFLDESSFMNYITSVGQPVTMTVEYAQGYTGENHPVSRQV